MKSLEARFAEVERRVQELVAENRGLRSRVRELEHELALARRAAREQEYDRGKRLRIREKVERILKELESVSGERQ